MVQMNTALFLAKLNFKSIFPVLESINSVLSEDQMSLKSGI